MLSVYYITPNRLVAVPACIEIFPMGTDHINLTLIFKHVNAKRGRRKI